MKQFKDFFTINLLILFFVFTACNKDDGDDHNLGTLTDPVASFSWTGNDTPPPVIIQFINSSQYADTYEWNFGDNSMTSTVKNPTHTYHNTSNKPRNYTITLKSIDSKTDKENIRSRVLVVQPDSKK